MFMILYLLIFNLISERLSEDALIDDQVRLRGTFNFLKFEFQFDFSDVLVRRYLNDY
jgi:hypothetical protein